jgi:phage terminase small subunit
VVGGKSAVDAYIKAGYHSKSRKVVICAASILSKNPKVRATIAAMQAETFNRLEISAEKVQRERAKIANL